MAARPPKLVERWEGLETQHQVMIALPLLAFVLFLAHLGPLNQPLGRAIGYGIFWALPVTAAVVAATAHERRKREARGDPPD